MVGKVVTILLGGYVALRICIALIPSITNIDPTGGASITEQIIVDMITIALWLLPVCAIAVILVWGANMIGVRGFHMRGRKSEDEDA